MRSAFLAISLHTLSAALAAADSPPPIAIPFHLEEPGYVTLVVENAEGVRVRNLVSETLYPAGAQVVHWDGLDDWDRDVEAAKNGVYRIPGNLVDTGTYRVRGLVRPAIEARYEMSVYTEGKPPWRTADKSSEWFTNHTPPTTVLWVPEAEAPTRGGAPTPGGQILVGSWVSEGGSGLSWLDTQGNKITGQGWVGGTWTGVTHLARDQGNDPVEGVYAYAATAWDNELRLSELRRDAGKAPGDTRMGTGEDQPVLTPKWTYPPMTPDLTDKGYGAGKGVGGLAVHNGRIFISLPILNQLLVVDARSRKTVDGIRLDDPRGVLIGADGDLLALSGRKLLKFSGTPRSWNVVKVESLIESGLDDPHSLTADPDGNLYISDHGDSHQVKVFSPTGKFLHAIGKPGKPQPGAYDPLHMNHPAGLAIDGKGRLWVAEDDFTPKRVSVWSPEGKLERAFYGPSQYGGGGELDPTDRNRFHYGGEGGAMTFELDWEKRTDRLIAVHSRSDHNPAQIPQHAIGAVQPQTVIRHAGHTYMTHVYGTSATGGVPFGFLYQLKDDRSNPCAGIGNVASWPKLAWSMPEFNKYFYVRWTGEVVAQTSGEHRFITESDDGVRLWVNHQKLIDRWEEKGRSEDSGTIMLTAGERYPITMEFYQNQGGALARLLWETDETPRVVVPPTHLYPTADATEPAGLTGEYAANSVYGDLRGATAFVTRIDPSIDFNWNQAGPSPLRTPDALAYQSRMPQDHRPGEPLLFSWSDADGDHQPKPEELTYLKGSSGGITIMPDLSIIAANVDGKAMRFAPAEIDSRGVPRYDLNRGEVLVEGAQDPVSSGGNQALVAENGWSVHTNAPAPFSPHGIGGVFQGKPMWSYPSLWHGLHASHQAPQIDQPGVLIGTTRLLGGFVTPRQGEAGPIWAINGNKGNVYLFTADGLLISTLFQDSRTAGFDAPKEEPGMLMNHLSLQEENFWPSLSQTHDGLIYLTGGSSSIMRLDGLDRIQRLAATPVEVTAAMRAAASEHLIQRELARQQIAEPKPWTVTVDSNKPTIDGNLDDWPAEAFVEIDGRAAAAIAISNNQLFAAFKTKDADLLRNQPESLMNLFKSGGALDLMLGNVEGGQRLLVTRVEGNTTAMLYRPRDADAPGEPAKFISMAGINKTTTIDRVENVSSRVALAGDEGNFEFSVPLEVLRLTPTAGQSIKGDIGVLRGNGFATLQRVYWHNKASGLVSDLATEAELTPALWGTLEFKN